MEALGLLLLACSCILVLGQAPTETKLTIVKIAPYDTINSICIGEKHKIRIQAEFISGTTNGVSIELILSITETVYVLGNVLSVTAGSGLSGLNSGWMNYVPYLTAESAAEQYPKQQYHSRLVFDIGTVTNNGADIATSSIIIEYEVVLLDLASNANGVNVWTSAGMAYDSGSRIWIAQVQMAVYDSASCSKTISNTASASVLSGTGELPLYSLTNRTISLLLAGPTNHIVVTVITLSGEVFPQKISVASVGTELTYSVQPNDIFSERFYGCNAADILTLDLGTIINKHAYVSTTDLTPASVTIDVSLQVMNTSLVGETVNVAYGININDIELFAASINESVTAATTSPALTLASISITPSLSIPIGNPGRFVLNIDTPPGSNLDYTVHITTSVNTAAAPALSILSVTPTVYGANLACPIPTMYQTLILTASAGVNNVGDYSFNISNFGLINNSSYNDLNRISLSIIAMIISTGVQGETHNLIVNVNSLGDKSSTVTVAAAEPYDDNVNFVMSLDADCTPVPSLHAGTNFTAVIQITAQRDTITGPMTIEFPIPENLTDSNLVPYRLWVDSKGINNLCPQAGEVELSMSSWNGSSMMDRAVAVIPLMCNFPIVDDIQQDMITIKMLIGVKDTEALNAVDNTAEELCVGVNYSPSQIWVSCLTFTRLAAIDLTSVKQITAINFNNAPPDDFRFEWSVDRITFYPSPYNYKVVTDPVSNVRTPERPIISRYYRMVNTRGSCPVNFTLTISAITNVRIYGPANSTEILMGNFMLALDNNSTTCMTLPVRGSPGTTPFLWLELDNSFLGILPNTTTGFSINVVGKSLSADFTNGGPQFTWMTFPAAAGVTPFAGARKRCDWTKPTDTMLSFTCPCTDVDQCAAFSLLFVFNATVVDPYELCEISVVSPTPVYV